MPVKGSHKQFCIRGHDTFLIGRDGGGNCKGCTRLYRDSHKDLIKKLNDNRHIDNQKAREYLNSYNIKHPGRCKIQKLKCKTNRGLRVVNWGQDGMDEYYRNIPHKMTVDHIIPLQGKLVSGLHVIWNLNYLPKSENSKKHNKIDLAQATRYYERLLIDSGLKNKGN